MNKTIIQLKVRGGYMDVETSENPRHYKCRYCPEYIIFAKTKKHKTIPVSENEDGEYIAHFANCEGYKALKQQRQRKK